MKRRARPVTTAVRLGRMAEVLVPAMWIPVSVFLCLTLHFVGFVFVVVSAGGVMGAMLWASTGAQDWD